MDLKSVNAVVILYQISLYTMYTLLFHLIGIDDVNSGKKLEELSVDLFNGFVRRTIGHGPMKPKTSLIVTSNQEFSETQRYSYKILHT